MYERNLPPYLVHDRDARKKGVEGRHRQEYKTYHLSSCDALLAGSDK